MGHIVSTKFEKDVPARYNFTVPFLIGAALNVRQARVIEAKGASVVTATENMHHQSHVISAIVQSVSALEALIWASGRYGPGHHLGSSPERAAQIKLLEPLQCEEMEPALDRYQRSLQLLSKPAFNKGEQPYQDAALVVKLRNEIIHYKSTTGAAVKFDKLLTAVAAKGHKKPPFYDKLGYNFWPLQCLSADCAEWARRTCVEFIDEYHRLAEVPSPLIENRAELTP